MAGEKIVGPDAAEIDAAVVVAVTVVEAEGVVVHECAGSEGVINGLLHRDGDTVDADLKSDDAFGCHFGHTPVGTNASTGDAEKGGIFAGSFGFA